MVRFSFGLIGLALSKPNRLSLNRFGNRFGHINGSFRLEPCQTELKPVWEAQTARPPNHFLALIGLAQNGWVGLEPY